MLATSEYGGQLKFIPDCYIAVGDFRIQMYVLPDISDSHSAEYATTNGTGRSLPSYTFSYGGARTINWTMHMYADTQNTLIYNLRILRLIESLTYPRTTQRSLPFLPPQIVKLKCGETLGSYEICAVLKSYSVKFPTDIQWSDATSGVGYIPYKFDIDLSMEAVYDAGTLPGAERIITDGN